MLTTYLKIASGLLATTYGFSEPYCGDVGNPRPCEYGAVTASGEIFNPVKPTAAIAAPASMSMRSRHIGLRTQEGPCKKIRLNDKMNPRYIGERGFDLTPAAVEKVTGKPPSKYWSGRLFVCNYKKEPRYETLLGTYWWYTSRADQLCYDRRKLALRVLRSSI